MGGGYSGPTSRGLEKSMLSPEGIRISKGEVVTMTTFIEPAPEEMPPIGGEDKISWLKK